MSGRRQRGHKPATLQQARCDRKSITWFSERRALIGAQFVANREHQVLAVYQCTHCKKWHLTHKFDKRRPDLTVRPMDALTRAIFETIHGKGKEQKPSRSIYTPSARSI